MRKSKKNMITYLLIILLLGITLGYAYLNTTLNINGTTNITSANWNIYWDNIQLGSNNVTDVATPATISTNKTEVAFNVNFKEPGDTYEFTVDAVNDGSIDAMVSVVNSGVYAANGTTPKTLPEYLEYTVTYSDGVPISQNHLLETGETETYKVRVHYKEDITVSQLPSTNDNYMFKFSVTYAQATSSALNRPITFVNSSWTSIVSAVKAGNTSSFHVGDAKEVDMGIFGTHLLRIANMSTPEECSTEGFSQTACGFVLEFADIITKHSMNSSSTNVGGWENSDIRQYLNSDIYNAMPSELKNAIIDTFVVSGYGKSDSSIFLTTDKLYYFSTVEIDGMVFNNYPDSSFSHQLDYYANYNSDSTIALKKYGNQLSFWCLRTPSKNDSTTFHGVREKDGWLNPYGSCSGVSPAFRIG